VLNVYMLIYVLGISTAAVGPYPSMDDCQIEARLRNQAYTASTVQELHGYNHVCVTSLNRPSVQDPRPGIGQGDEW
jgi:hypothetical protein